MAFDHSSEDVAQAIEKLSVTSELIEKLMGASMTIVRVDGKDVEQYHVTLTAQQRAELGGLVATMEQMIRNEFGKDIQCLSQGRA